MKRRKAYSLMDVLLALFIMSLIALYLLPALKNSLLLLEKSKKRASLRIGIQNSIEEIKSERLKGTRINLDENIETELEGIDDDFELIKVSSREEGGGDSYEMQIILPKK